MALLTREQILQADDRPFEDVPVPEWGGDVRIRGLSGTDRDQFDADSIIKVGQDRQKGRRRDEIEVNLNNMRARLVAACAIDGQGDRLFSVEDVIALGKKSAIALQRCFEVAQRLSGLTDDDLAELEKN